ncbi:hypothetical protein [Yoonia sp. 208BN28-4]|uniref:hypothetical protein n=1 Tax=Yoonia sp. 208BN28-4 TaxID=3126505 RepID=UPI003096B8F1
MIISRQLAKGRIAKGERPGFLAAWGPVLLDWVAIIAVLALLFDPVMWAIYAAQPGDGITFAILFGVFFVPMQIVLIISSMWAVRSRWQDLDGNQSR